MLDNALSLPSELRAVRHYRFDLSPLAELAVPTLILVGELSGPEVHGTALQVAGALQHARVFTLPGQGHAAMFSAPELLASEMRRFVDALASPRPSP